MQWGERSEKGERVTKSKEIRVEMHVDPFIFHCDYIFEILGRNACSVI